MFTRQEIINFRCKILQSRSKLKEWCKERGINYNVFIQEINGFRTKEKSRDKGLIRTQDKHEQAIREFIGNKKAKYRQCDMEDMSHDDRTFE